MTLPRGKLTPFRVYKKIFDEFHWRHFDLTALEIQQRNESQPVAKCPDEVLEEIFLFATLQAPPSQPRRGHQYTGWHMSPISDVVRINVHALFTISWTCTRWRRVALAHSALWARCAAFQALGWKYDVCIRRSGGMLLDSVEDIDPDRWDLVERLRSVRMGLWEMPRVFNAEKPLPDLQVLSVWTHSTGSEIDARLLSPIRMPNLKELRLGFGVKMRIGEFDTGFLRNLTVLQVHGHSPDESLEAWLEALGGMSGLRDLALHFGKWPTPTIGFQHTVPQVVLPHVTAFSSNAPYTFLANLSFPRLRHCQLRYAVADKDITPVLRKYATQWPRLKNDSRLLLNLRHREIFVFELQGVLDKPVDSPVSELDIPTSFRLEIDSPALLRVPLEASAGEAISALGFPFLESVSHLEVDEIPGYLFDPGHTLPRLLFSTLPRVATMSFFSAKARFILPHYILERMAEEGPGLFLPDLRSMEIDLGLRPETDWEQRPRALVHALLDAGFVLEKMHGHQRFRATLRDKFVGEIREKQDVDMFFQWWR